MTAVKDFASVKVAVQTATSDVAADKAAGGKRGGGGRRCGRGHGTTAGVVASVGVAAQDDRGGCRIERIRLLDG